MRLGGVHRLTKLVGRQSLTLRVIEFPSSARFEVDNVRGG
jgi:hypothetical protein